MKFSGLGIGTMSVIALSLGGSFIFSAKQAAPSPSAPVQTREVVQTTALAPSHPTTVATPRGTEKAPEAERSRPAPGSTTTDRTPQELVQQFPPEEVGPELESLFSGISVPATAWATDKEYALRTLMDDSTLPGAVLRSAQCKGGLCRIELEFDNETVDRDFFSKYFLDPESPMGMDYSIVVLPREALADGTISAKAFLMSKGKVEAPDLTAP